MTATGAEAFGQSGNPQLGIGNKDSVLIIVDLISPARRAARPRTGQQPRSAEGRREGRHGDRAGLLRRQDARPERRPAASSGHREGQRPDGDDAARRHGRTTSARSTAPRSRSTRATAKQPVASRWQRSVIQGWTRPCPARRSAAASCSCDPAGARLRRRRSPACRHKGTTRCTSWSTSSGQASRRARRRTEQHGGAQERASAQPAHHAARPAALRRQGADPRDPLPGLQHDAFEKMFERDKEELRSLGVPIEVGSMDAYFDDEPGYRIRADEFALPDIELTADEAAVIGLATRVWEHARLAEATTEAVRKLTAAGRPHRRLRPRHRRAAAQRRRAVVRRVLGGHPGPDAGRVRLPPRRASTQATHPAPPALGRGPLLRALVRRRLRHRPRRGAGLPPLPGPGRGPAHGAGRARTTCRPAPTSATWPAGWRRPRRPERAVAAGAPRRRPRAAPRRRERGAGRRRPRRPHRAGTGWSSAPRRSGLADELLAYGADVYVEEPAPCATGRAPGCAAAVEGRQHERSGRPSHRRPVRAPRTRSPGC